MSCGTTRIVPSHDNLDIFINGKYAGNNNVNITRSGLPKKIHIQVKANGLTLSELTVRRNITLGTVLVGSWTYGLGFIFDWRYPEMIFIPIDLPSDQKTKGISPWDKPKETSVWDKPLKP
jgi:hypothetical protein